MNQGTPRFGGVGGAEGGCEGRIGGAGEREDEDVEQRLDHVLIRSHPSLITQIRIDTRPIAIERATQINDQITRTTATLTTTRAHIAAVHDPQPVVDG